MLEKWCDVIMDEKLKNEYVKCGLDYIRKYIRMSIQDFDYGNSLVADLEIKKELEEGEIAILLSSIQPHFFQIFLISYYA